MLHSLRVESHLLRPGEKLDRSNAFGTLSYLYALR